MHVFQKFMFIHETVGDHSEACLVHMRTLIRWSPDSANTTSPLGGRRVVRSALIQKAPIMDGGFLFTVSQSVSQVFALPLDESGACNACCAHLADHLDRKTHSNCKCCTGNDDGHAQ